MNSQPADKWDLWRSLLLTAARLAIHFFVLLVVFVVLCKPVISFKHFFEQYDTKLPVTTHHVLHLSDRMNSHFHVIIPGLIVIDGVALLGLQLLKRPWRFLARVWFSAAILGAFVLVSWSLLAIAFPVDSILTPERQVLIPPAVEP